MKTENEAQFNAIEGGRIILTWHGRTAVPGPKFRNRNWGVMISHSNDGDIQKYIYESLGYHVIRGSSGRGGERALIESIRFLREGNTMAMTPDGPRGPAGQVQLGVLLMAKKSGAKLVPWGVAARPRWLAKSWDRFLVPYPFARAVVVMGDAITVPKDASDEDMEQLRLHTEREMHRVQILAERKCGEPAPGAPKPRPVDLTIEEVQKTNE